MQSHDTILLVEEPEDNDSDKTTDDDRLELDKLMHNIVTYIQKYNGGFLIESLNTLKCNTINISFGNNNNVIKVVLIEDQNPILGVMFIQTDKNWKKDGKYLWFLGEINLNISSYGDKNPTNIINSMIELYKNIFSSSSQNIQISPNLIAVKEDAFNEIITVIYGEILSNYKQYLKKH